MYLPSTSGPGLHHRHQTGHQLRLRPVTSTTTSRSTSGRRYLPGAQQTVLQRLRPALEAVRDVCVKLDTHGREGGGGQQTGTRQRRMSTSTSQVNINITCHISHSKNIIHDRLPRAPYTPEVGTAGQMHTCGSNDADEGHCRSKELAETVVKKLCSF